MSANGHLEPVNTNPEISLTIIWSPNTGQVKIAFPQIDVVGILGLLEMAKVVLLDQRSKAESRISIPDMNVTKRLIT